MAPALAILHDGVDGEMASTETVFPKEKRRLPPSAPGSVENDFLEHRMLTAREGRLATDRLVLIGLLGP
jgi:hypothetical protein